jgi:REP element-mobilizing transposase RayT
MRAEWESFFEIESDKLRRAALESFLDRGHGACWLRKSDIAELTENALRHGHGNLYELRAWVVMPNHVHVLFNVNAVPMGKIVRSWKRYIAEIANGWLRRKGQFWQPEYWDTFMRDRAHEERVRNYIERNPVNAQLVGDMRDWKWGSARHLGEDGCLKI